MVKRRLAWVTNFNLCFDNGGKGEKCFDRYGKLGDLTYTGRFKGRALF